MNKILRVIVALPGILFVVIGLSWLVDPAGAAKNLGMTLFDGLGRSSQIADFGAFFTTGGCLVLIGVITQKRTWLYAPAMMLCFAAVFRILAWLIQGAAFAGPQIAVEVVLTGLLLFAASRLPSDS
jgi:hypothetical protein